MPMRHLQIKHLMSESRMLSILLGGALLQDMVDPVLLIASVPSSVLTHVAGLTGRPLLIACLFGACAVLLVPFLAVSLWRGFDRYCRGAAKLACLSLAVGAVVWSYMGLLSMGLGTGTLSNIFIRNAVMSLGFAAALAVSLNNQQIRQQHQRGMHHDEGVHA